jgi:hypothetical protein
MPHHDRDEQEDDHLPRAILPRRDTSRNTMSDPVTLDTKAHRFAVCERGVQ